MQDRTKNNRSTTSQSVLIHHLLHAQNLKPKSLYFPFALIFSRLTLTLLEQLQVLQKVMNQEKETVGKRIPRCENTLQAR